MSSRNILLTGVPRSGTTLLAALMDGAPDSVALNEPKWQYDWAEHHRDQGAPAFVNWLANDFAVTREKLLRGIPIEERRGADGAPVTNYYRRDTQETTYRMLHFTRPGLSPDFTLAMKQNGLYLGTLPKLVECGLFTIIAIVRHPVGVISSWNRSPIPQREGRIPGASLYWEKMRDLTNMPIELLEKQVRMMDLMCQRLHDLRDHIRVVRHEDVTADPGILEDFIPGAAGRGAKLIRRTPTPAPDAEIIAEAVQKFGPAIRYFYPEG
jgi:hypothetical protein